MPALPVPVLRLELLCVLAAGCCTVEGGHTLRCVATSLDSEMRAVLLWDLCYRPSVWCRACVSVCEYVCLHKFEDPASAAGVDATAPGAVLGWGVFCCRQVEDLPARHGHPGQQAPSSSVRCRAGFAGCVSGRVCAVQKDHLSYELVTPCVLLRAGSRPPFWVLRSDARGSPCAVCARLVMYVAMPLVC